MKAKEGSPKKPSKAEVADRKLDRTLGIKQGSAKDLKIDKAVGVYKEEYGNGKGEYGGKGTRKKSTKGNYPPGGNYP